MRDNAQQFSDNAKKIKNLAYKAMGYSWKAKAAFSGGIGLAGFGIYKFLL